MMTPTKEIYYRPTSQYITDIYILILPFHIQSDDIVLKSSIFNPNMNNLVICASFNPTLSASRKTESLNTLVSGVKSQYKAIKELRIISFDTEAEIALDYILDYPLSNDTFVMIAMDLKDKIDHQSKISTLKDNQTLLDKRLIIVAGHGDEVFTIGKVFGFVKQIEPIINVETHIIESDHSIESWITGLDFVYDKITQ